MTTVRKQQVLVGAVGLFAVAVFVLVVLPFNNFYALIGRQSDYIDERAEAWDGTIHIRHCLENAWSSKVETAGLSIQELSQRFGEHTRTRISAERYPLACYEIVHLAFSPNGEFIGVIVVHAPPDATAREFRFDYSKWEATKQAEIYPKMPEE